MRVLAVVAASLLLALMSGPTVGQVMGQPQVRVNLPDGPIVPADGSPATFEAEVVVTDANNAVVAARMAEGGIVRVALTPECGPEFFITVPQTLEIPVDPTAVAGGAVYRATFQGQARAGPEARALVVGSCRLQAFLEPSATTSEAFVTHQFTLSMAYQASLEATGEPTRTSARNGIGYSIPIVCHCNARTSLSVLSVNGGEPGDKVTVESVTLGTTAGEAGTVDLVVHDAAPGDALDVVLGLAALDAPTFEGDAFQIQLQMPEDGIAAPTPMMPVVALVLLAVALMVRREASS